MYNYSYNGFFGRPLKIYRKRRSWTQNQYIYFVFGSFANHFLNHYLLFQPLFRISETNSGFHWDHGKLDYMRTMWCKKLTNCTVVIFKISPRQKVLSMAESNKLFAFHLSRALVFGRKNNPVCFCPAGFRSSFAFLELFMHWPLCCFFVWYADVGKRSCRSTASKYICDKRFFLVCCTVNFSAPCISVHVKKRKMWIFLIFYKLSRIFRLLFACSLKQLKCRSRHLKTLGHITIRGDTEWLEAGFNRIHNVTSLRDNVLKYLPRLKVSFGRQKYFVLQFVR